MWRLGLCCSSSHNGNRKGTNVCPLTNSNNRNATVTVSDVLFPTILNRNVTLIFTEADLFTWYFNLRNVVSDVYLGCLTGGQEFPWTCGRDQ